jgi:hypothetical protein
MKFQAVFFQNWKQNSIALSQQSFVFRYLCVSLFIRENNLIMTIITVNIKDKRSEKVVKAFFDALDIQYQVKEQEEEETRSLNEKEEELYTGLKRSIKSIKKWENGDLELKDAKTLFNELSD